MEVNPRKRALPVRRASETERQLFIFFFSDSFVVFIVVIRAFYFLRFFSGSQLGVAFLFIIVRYFIFPRANFLSLFFSSFSRVGTPC